MPTPRPARIFRNGLSTWAHLAIFGMAVLVPVLVVLGIVAARFAEAERQQTLNRAENVAAQVSLNVDRELDGVQAALLTLASSDAVQRGDLAAFTEQARLVLRYRGVNVVMRDRNEQQVVNADAPPGTRLPVSHDPELVAADRQVFATGQPSVTDLYAGALTRHWRVSVNVPVLRQGVPTYVLDMSLAPEQLARILQLRGVPGDWTISVIDGSDRIIARSRAADRFVGTLATEDLRRAAVGAQGSWIGRTADGIEVLGAYVRSPLSGWRIAVGVPLTLVMAPVRASAMLVAGLWVAGLLFSALVALLYGRALARPIHALAGDAAALGRGEPIAPRQTWLRDVNDVGAALSDAARDLRERAAQRDLARAALEDNRSRLDRILSAVPVAIVERDAAGRVRYANATARGMLHLEPLPRGGLERPPEWRMTWLDGTPVAEEDRPSARARAGEMITDHVCALLGPDGSRTILQVITLPVADPGGQGPSTLSVMADITDRARAEEELRQLAASLDRRVTERTAELSEANRQLRAEIVRRGEVEGQLRQAQKMEAVGRLTGGVAHDFNNLLTVVIGSLDLLRRRLSGAEDRLLRLVDNATEAAIRCATLTQRLLAFSRQQPLAPVVLDVNRLVAGMSELLHRTLGETCQVETVLGGGLWRANADPNQLEAALLNLAVNGRDAMPDGGRLTLETANTYLDEAYVIEAGDGLSAGQYVMIAVTDTGSGMDAETVARAFDPFFTTKPPGKGTGLGLSQVYGFVKQSGGHVRIYSEPGRGTTIRLYLPRGFDTAAEIPTLPTVRTVAAGGGETLLLVEDEPGVRRFGAETLRELGYTVLEAADAAAALRLLDGHAEVALLLTDVVLPDIDGRRLAEQALRRRPDLPVLFATGYTRNAIVHNGMLDRDVRVLIKPFTVDQLATAVRHALESRVVTTS